jgi:hypothetical protein
MRSGVDAMLDFLAQCRNEIGQLMQILCTEATLELHDLLMHVSEHSVPVNVG